MDLEVFAAVLAEIEEADRTSALTAAKYVELRESARAASGDEWDELAEAVENFAP